MTGTILGDGAHHTSSQFAVFCEKILVRERGQTVGRWLPADVVLVKTFIGNNIRKDPKQPVGAKDPFILRGTACAQQVVYATRAVRRIADYSLWSTYRRYREEIKTETFNRWKFVHVPIYLGGLGYPSTASDKRIWRKRVPRNVKQILANFLSDNERAADVVRYLSLNSLNYCNSKNMVEQYEEVLNLFEDVPDARESRKLTDDSKDLAIQSRGKGDSRLGILTYEDLVRLSVDSTHQSSRGLGTALDSNGRSLTDRRSFLRRTFRRHLSTNTNWMPFTELVRLCLRDASLRALLRGRAVSTPFFSYGSYMSTRSKRIKKAEQLLTSTRLRGTPPIKFRNFYHLSERLRKKSSELWVNRDHDWIAELIAQVGELELGEPD
jgi:hypothetical protein